MIKNNKNYLKILFLLAFTLSACSAPDSASLTLQAENTPAAPEPDAAAPTALPTRPAYDPGELVDYTAQDGDTLPALAARFNTTEREIRAANPILPDQVTTMPPGLPMQIPIYYEPLWGSPFQILPNSLFANGPEQMDFDVVAYVNSKPGWLKTFVDYAGGNPVQGGQIINAVAVNFSISPRLLLAIVEYQTEALTEPTPAGIDLDYPLGIKDSSHQGLYQQLIWTANTLNNIFYDYQTGGFTSFKHLDGRIENTDPWQNGATVALQYYFSRAVSEEEYNHAVLGDGFLKTYTNLFGDPWANPTAAFPGSLQQPEFKLPFAAGKSWAFTGAPHTGWGTGAPFAALDFAPPSVVGGCTPSNEWSTAVADGIIVRKETGLAVLDMDGDGDERTGWNMLYLHLATASIPPVGTALKAGDPIGLPSCEGGSATGTHVHIARKYNGEWVPAAGTLAFNLEGWIAQENSEAYQGELQRFGKVVRACECSDLASQIQSRIVP